MIRDCTAAIAVHDPACTAGGTHQALKVADAMGRPVIRMNIAANTVTITRTMRNAETSIVASRSSDAGETAHLRARPGRGVNARDQKCCS